MNDIKIIGLGALNMDYIFQVELLSGDSEIAGSSLGHGYEDSKSEPETCPGGSAANTIYGLARLGVYTGFIGAVGDDADGKALVNDFQKIGVDTSQIKIKTRAKTGEAVCLTDKLNFRELLVSPGSANSLLAMKDINLDYLNEAEMLHISSFVDGKQFKVLLEIIARLESSVKISFSPGSLYVSKGLPTLTPILARTHILFLNDSEIRQLTGEDFASGATRCLDLGCRIVVVTLGKGASYKNRKVTSYIRTADEEYAVEPGDKSIISTADTIGAGDAFATGFLYGYLNGKGLEECGRLGDIVARFSISRVGARTGLPTLDQLSQRYRELYHRDL